MSVLRYGIHTQGLTAISAAAPNETSAQQPLVVWRFVDGKPGHENQSAGLLRALEQLHPVDVHTLPPIPAWKAILGCISAGFPGSTSLPSPQLIMGAGHRTHLSMLVAKRARGGHTVVLMKPSLPASWFDLCVVPEHDAVPAARNIVLTRGVLNTIVPGGQHDITQGLIMIGGPSSHYQWDETQLLSALTEIIHHDDMHWTLTTSRRTPDTTVGKLQSLAGITLVPWQQTDRDWVPEQLKTASRVWITEDSVSMIYEALTSGASCGILPVPHAGTSRISDSVAKLVQDGVVTGFSQWQAGGTMSVSPVSLNEAARVAAEIMKRWFSNRA